MAARRCRSGGVRGSSRSPRPADIGCRRKAPVGESRMVRRGRDLLGSFSSTRWVCSASAGDDGDRGEVEGTSTSEREPALVASWKSRKFPLFPARSPYDGEIFTLALPALLSVLIDPLMSIVDTAIIGSFAPLIPSLANFPKSY